MRNPYRPLHGEILEPRHLLSGITLITHGFNGSVDDWITAMADAIAARPDLSPAQPRFRVDVTDPGHDGGPLSVVNTSRSGPAAADYTGATDIVILLNWSDVAGSLSLGGGYHRSTTDVAAAVAEKMRSPNFLIDLATPVAELPIHLIGHSRGASLVGELAKKLGEQGIWVDQVTTLDPHPVDGVREPWLFNYNFSDPPMAAWNNVAFWDNYWRTDGASSFDFTGESVANTFDIQLSESTLTNGGYSFEHSDVHLWYHGTIDTSATATDGAYAVSSSWYGGVHPARGATGFFYSRPVGGPRPIAGLAAELGGSANRMAINWSQAQWPNVMELNVSGGDLQFVSGEPIPLSYYYQDYDSAATIVFSLDPDQNPYTSNAVGNWNQLVSPTAATPVPGDYSLSTSGIPNGTYYVAAKITDLGGHTRYAYSHNPLAIVTPIPATRTWDGGGTDNQWSSAANWAGDVAPLAGDNLVFPAGVAKLQSINDYPAGTVFGSINVSGGNYLFQNGFASSSSIQVSSGSLTTASIVCDTLTLGAASGAASDTATRVANDSVIGIPAVLHSIPSEPVIPIVAGNEVAVPHAIDKSKYGGSRRLDPVQAVSARADSVISVPSLEEVIRAAFMSVSQAISIPTTGSTVSLPIPTEHRNYAAHVGEPLNKDLFAMGVLVAPRLTTTAISIHPVRATDRLSASLPAAAIDSVAETMKRPSIGLAKSQSTRKLALQALMRDYPYHAVVEERDSELMGIRHLRKQEQLVQEAVDEFHANLVRSDGWK